MIGLHNPVMLALLLAAAPVVYRVFKADELEEKVVGASKIAAIILLGVGAASPYLVTTEQLSEKPTVTILSDETTSTELIEDYSLELEGVNTVTRTVASGNQSKLKQSILRNIEEDTPYLLISDGHGTESLEGLAQRFRQKNATLHALKPGMTEEASVKIEGPSSTVIGAENSYTVKVQATNGTPTPLPEVTVDGEQIELEREQHGEYSFTRSFSSEQDHTIKASIGIEDRFQSNNQYFKTVEVTEKPEILVLGQQAGLSSELQEFYDLTYSSTIPNDLNEYYAVIAKEQFEEDQLASYITEGNGLIYTGDYEQENEVLPVREVDESQLSRGAKIMLAIDISGGSAECYYTIESDGWEPPEGEQIEDKEAAMTGWQYHVCKTDSAVKDSIKVAYSLVDILPYNNRIGVLSYNRDAYMISRPKPLSSNRKELKEKISSLSPSGPSFHNNGVKGAKKTLNSTGNIILISDGNVGGLADNKNVPQKTKQIASSLNVRLITVGVGENTNENFLRNIVNRGNGQYLDSRESGRLNFLFAGGGTEDRAKKLVVVDPSHFITSGVETSAAVGNFDPVKSKLSADTLVTSTDGKPVLSAWRYGLGRVASFSAGSKDLGRISASDPELVSRTVSWAVGQPERKEERTFKVEDSRQGSPVEAEASYKVEGLNRQGENLYTADLQPESLGFHEFEGEIYGYSYTEELEDIGYNTGLDRVVESTGGTTFSPSEEEEIISEVENFSNRKVETQKPLSDYFILAAFIVFLSEVGYRKLNGRK